MVTSDTSARSCKILIQWMLKRLKSSGICGSNAQSLALALTEIQDLQDYPKLIFFQYLFDGIEHPVTPVLHGNDKRQFNPGYKRTKESTVKKLRDAASSRTPTVAYHVVHKEKGGLLHASSISDLPRNRDQAKYARRGNTSSTNFEDIDSLAILLEQCKRQQINPVNSRLLGK